MRLPFTPGGECLPDLGLSLWVLAALHEVLDVGVDIPRAAAHRKDAEQDVHDGFRVRDRDDAVPRDEARPALHDRSVLILLEPRPPLAGRAVGRCKHALLGEVKLMDVEAGVAPPDRAVDGLRLPEHRLRR